MLSRSIKNVCRSIGWAIVLILNVEFPIIGCAQQRPDTGVVDSFDGYWRDQEHDGANVLYVFLKLSGYPGAYQHLINASPESCPPKNLLQMKKTAAKIGFELSINAVTPSDLGRLDVPTIVHLDGETPGAGTFVLLLVVQQNRFIYLDGSSAEIVSVHPEEVLRRWSGIVASLKRKSSFYYEIAFGIPIGFAIGFVRKRVGWERSDV